MTADPVLSILIKSNNLKDGEMMNRYTVAQAAAQLDVSRQTVYKYVNRDKNRYTLTETGNIYVTAYGLDLLRSDMKEKQSTADKGADIKSKSQPSTLTELTTLRIQLDAQQARTAELEQVNSQIKAQLDVLSAKYDGAQQLIEQLQRENEQARISLHQEQMLHARTQEMVMPVKTSWIKKLFSKVEKAETDPGDTVE